MDMSDCIQVYKGDYFQKNSNKQTNKKVVVFDLDETLGSFLELNILFNTLDYVLQDENILSISNILDLFPEFFRNNIFQILQYVYKKKKSGECNKVYIYTNNQSKSQTVSNIVDYITKKIVKTNEKLFDQIIYAFKINGQVVQVGRSSHYKTCDDLIRCTLLPKKTAICFLDDVYFDEMNKERIYYIQPKAYFHGLSSHDILNRLFTSKYEQLVNKYMNSIEDHYFTRCIKSRCFYRTNTRNNKTMLLHDSISKKMLYHIKDFFHTLRRKNKTLKRKSITRSFTRKRKSQ